MARKRLIASARNRAIDMDAKRALWTKLGEVFGTSIEHVDFSQGIAIDATLYRITQPDDPTKPDRLDVVQTVSTRFRPLDCECE